jgi:hypothetical protein
VPGIGIKVRDELSIDLEILDGELRQAAQRRMPSAEVVDCNVHARGGKPIECLGRGLQASHQRAFRNFDVDVPIDADEWSGRAQQRVDELAAPELQGRDVDGNRYRRQPAGVPVKGVGDRLLDDPLADVDDESRLFQRRYELSRRTQSTRRVLPAQERFDTRDPTRIQNELRLVVEQKLLPIEAAYLRYRSPLVLALFMANVSSSG